MAKLSLRARLESKIREDESGCWIWTGYVGPHGYGMIHVSWNAGTSMPAVAHRVSYELNVGPIPEGLVLDHLCKVRACVNPAHLEPVSQGTNFLRSDHPSARAVRTGHCKRGHELINANLNVRPDGKRDCRACVRERNAARSQRPRI